MKNPDSQEQTQTAQVFSSIPVSNLIDQIAGEVEKRLSQPQAEKFQLYTRREAAVILRCTLVTIDRYMRDGLISYSKVGDKIFISHFDLLDTLARCRRGAKMTSLLRNLK